MHSDTANDARGNRILRLSDAVKKTGLSRSGIYQRIRARKFPQPVRLGARAVGFVEREVDAFLSELMANRTQAGGACSDER